jgi:hypothetical protein
MKYNDEIVGEQYEIRELVIINFIEWYASEEEDREPLRQAMQLYLQQELWVDFEGMKLKDTREKINVVNELEAIIENSKYYKDITGDLDNLKHRLIKEDE